MELGRGTKTRQVRVAFGLISYLVLNYYLVPRVHVCARVFVVPKQYIYRVFVVQEQNITYIARGNGEKNRTRPIPPKNNTCQTCIKELEDRSGNMSFSRRR